MKFNVNDVKPDFMMKKQSRSRVKVCSSCAEQFKGDKFDTEQNYNKAKKIWVMKFIKNHPWKTEPCMNVDCNNRITHGVYGVKLIAETV